MHFWQLIKDAYNSDKIIDKFKIWFMPTGWRPFDLLDKIMQSNLLNIPSKMIEVFLSDEILNKIFSIPMTIIDIPFKILNAMLGLLG